MKKRSLLSLFPTTVTRLALIACPMLYAASATAQHNTETPAYGYYTNSQFGFKIPLANTDDYFQRIQILYPPNSVKTIPGGAGTTSGSITKVFLRSDPKITKTFNMKNVLIKLGQTTDTAYNTTVAENAYFPTTEVFKQATYTLSTPGWIEFTLSKAFQYDHTKTLVVEVSADEGFNCTYDAIAGKAIGSKFTDAKGGNLPSLYEFGFSFNATGVENIPNETKVQVYPNPADEMLQISSDKKITGTIAIIDINGRTVMQDKINGISHSISVSILANGLYFYKILDENNAQVSTGKLTISH